MKSIDSVLKDSLTKEISIPASLHGIEERSLVRYQTYKRVKRAKNFSFSFIAVLLFLFYSANSSLSFAQNLKSLPIFSELLEVFRFEDEIEGAVQEIGMVLSNEKSEVYLQYVMSDEKRILLYFQFPEEMDLTEYDLIELNVLEAYDVLGKENYAPFFFSPTHAFGSHYEKENRYLSLFGVIPLTIEAMMPEELGMKFQLSLHRRTYDTTLETQEIIDLGEFSFEIPLTRTMKTLQKPIKKSFHLFDIPMELESIENSPLGRSILFKQKDLSTYRVKQLLGRIEDADTGLLLSDELLTGFFSEKTGHFSIGYGDVDLEETKRLKITLTGANLMPIASEYAVIDLEGKKLAHDVEGLELLRVVRGKNVTQLAFKFTPKQGTDQEAFSVFSSEYLDESGAAHRIDSKGLSVINENYFIETVTIDSYVQGTITLKQIGTNGYETYLEKPLVFYVDVPEKPALPELGKENP